MGRKKKRKKSTKHLRLMTVRRKQSKFSTRSISFARHLSVNGSGRFPADWYIKMCERLVHAYGWNGERLNSEMGNARPSHGPPLWFTSQSFLATHLLAPIEQQIMLDYHWPNASALWIFLLTNIFSHRYEDSEDDSEEGDEDEDEEEEEEEQAGGDDDDDNAKADGK